MTFDLKLSFETSLQIKRFLSEVHNPPDTQLTIQVEYVEHLRWYWWENMYAGVEEDGGAAAEPEGGIP